MSVLDGKVVLITGGNSGIGKGVAAEVVARGGHAIIVGRSRDKLQAAADEIGGGVTPIVADVSDVSAIEEMISQATQRFGALDGLVANAGFGAFKKFADLTEDDFDKVFDVNVKGVFFTVQKTLPIMKRGGSIVVTASWTSHRGLEAGAAYAATKGAVNTLVKVLASELRGQDIRINSISPGMIDTPAISEMGERERAFWNDQIPAGRFGTPADVGKAVAFLLSDDAIYISGEDLLIDGALTRTVRMNF